MFFGSWQSLLRILIVGAAAYVALVVLLRIAGSRSLAKLNAFDLVVTIALGSTLSSILLDRTVPLADGITAFAVLIGLQFGVSWASARSERFQSLTRSKPVVVFRNGEPVPHALKAVRLTESDVTAVMRQARVACPARVEAVVLETSGDLSVVMSEPSCESGASSLSSLEQGPEDRDGREAEARPVSAHARQRA